MEIHLTNLSIQAMQPEVQWEQFIRIFLFHKFQQTLKAQQQCFLDVPQL